LNTLAYLHRRFQVDVTVVPVDHDGMVDPERIAGTIKPETVLVSIMHANNEVGTIQQVQEIARLARREGVLLHVDGAQSVGKIDTVVDDLGVDLFSLAGHKLYGPKGIGALYVRKGTKIDPLIHGSSQEHGPRAGTENVASIVGLGAACEIVAHAAKKERVRLRSLRDALHLRLEERIPGLLLNGHPQQRLPNTLNVSVPEVSGQETLAHASEVAASTGAACHSGSTEPSSVLISMGFSRERALGAMRLSLGRWSVPDDVERAASSLAQGYETARAMQNSLEVPIGS
jgi:cysteine desulfurase